MPATAAPHAATLLAFETGATAQMERLLDDLGPARTQKEEHRRERLRSELRRILKADPS